MVLKSVDLLGEWIKVNDKGCFILPWNIYNEIAFNKAKKV